MLQHKLIYELLQVCTHTLTLYPLISTPYPLLAIVSYLLGGIICAAALLAGLAMVFKPLDRAYDLLHTILFFFLYVLSSIGYLPFMGKAQLLLV